MLLSSILNYGTRAPGLDEAYVDYAAHVTRLSRGSMTNCRKSRPTWARSCSKRATSLRGEYARPWPKARRYPQPRRTPCRPLARIDGPERGVPQAGESACEPSRFRKELLRDERRTVGRYDGRFEGIDFDAAGEKPDFRRLEHRYQRRLYCGFQQLLGATS